MSDFTSEVDDLDPILQALGRRDLNREGIPTFLVLEDLTRSPSSEITANGRLSQLAENYLDRLVSDRSRLTLGEIATVLEVLGACHFDPIVGSSPIIESAALGELVSGTLVRAINFHNTPRSLEDEFDRQLVSAGEKFRAIGEEDLDGLISEHPWPHSKPPLLPVFYEGYRNNYDVALPLLERAGLRGWFFIPTAFIDTPVAEQRSFARAHQIGLTEDEHGNERYAMTWDELRDVVARGHVVCCHTATHCAVTSISDTEDAQRELIESRVRLEDELDREIRTLAWLLGTPYGENSRVDAFVREAGYRTIFSNARIQRIPETQ